MCVLVIDVWVLTLVTRVRLLSPELDSCHQVRELMTLFENGNNETPSSQYRLLHNRLKFERGDPVAGYLVSPTFFSWNNDCDSDHVRSRRLLLGNEIVRVKFAPPIHIQRVSRLSRCHSDADRTDM